MGFYLYNFFILRDTTHKGCNMRTTSSNTRVKRIFLLASIATVILVVIGLKNLPGQPARLEKANEEVFCLASRLLTEDAGQQLQSTFLPTDTRYRLIRKLGEGGMGTVVLAQDIQTGKNVAIKFVNPMSEANSTEKKIESIKNECVSLAYLNALFADDPEVSENFVQLDSAFASEKLNRETRFDREYAQKIKLPTDAFGNPYFVMEYVEGQSLGDLIAREINGIKVETLSPQDKWGITIQVITIVKKLHEKGIYHADIKPDNFMVSRNEEGRLIVRLCDFGYAKGKRFTDIGIKTGFGFSVDYVNPANLQRYYSNYTAPTRDAELELSRGFNYAEYDRFATLSVIYQLWNNKRGPVKTTGKGNIAKALSPMVALRETIMSSSDAELDAWLSMVSTRLSSKNGIQFSPFELSETDIDFLKELGSFFKRPVSSFQELIMQAINPNLPTEQNTVSFFDGFLSKLLAIDKNSDKKTAAYRYIGNSKMQDPSGNIVYIDNNGTIIDQDTWIRSKPIGFLDVETGLIHLGGGIFFDTESKTLVDGTIQNRNIDSQQIQIRLIYVGNGQYYDRLSGKLLDGSYLYSMPLTFEDTELGLIHILSDIFYDTKKSSYIDLKNWASPITALAPKFENLDWARPYPALYRKDPKKEQQASALSIKLKNLAAEFERNIRGTNPKEMVPTRAGLVSLGGSFCTSINQTTGELRVLLFTNGSFIVVKQEQDSHIPYSGILYYKGRIYNVKDRQEATITPLPGRFGMYLLQNKSKTSSSPVYLDPETGEIINSEQWVQKISTVPQGARIKIYWPRPTGPKYAELVHCKKGIYFDVFEKCLVDLKTGVAYPKDTIPSGLSREDISFGSGIFYIGNGEYYSFFKSEEQMDVYIDFITGDVISKNDWEDKYQLSNELGLFYVRKDLQTGKYVYYNVAQAIEDTLEELVNKKIVEYIGVGMYEINKKPFGINYSTGEIVSRETLLNDVLHNLPENKYDATYNIYKLSAAYVYDFSYKIIVSVLDGTTLTLEEYSEILDDLLPAGIRIGLLHIDGNQYYDIVSDNRVVIDIEGNQTMGLPKLLSMKRSQNTGELPIAYIDKQTGEIVNASPNMDVNRYAPIYKKVASAIEDNLGTENLRNAAGRPRGNYEQTIAIPEATTSMPGEIFGETQIQTSV